MRIDWVPLHERFLAYKIRCLGLTSMATWSRFRLAGIFRGAARTPLRRSKRSPRERCQACSHHWRSEFLLTPMLSEKKTCRWCEGDLVLYILFGIIVLLQLWSSVSAAFMRSVEWRVWVWGSPVMNSTTREGYFSSTCTCCWCYNNCLAIPRQSKCQTRKHLQAAKPFSHTFIFGQFATREAVSSVWKDAPMEFYAVPTLY